MFVLYYIIFCVAVAFLGRNRRIGALGFFIVSLLLTPVIALLILVLTTDRRLDLPSS
jgi:hypothetical protein